MDIATFVLTAICAITGSICAYPIVNGWWHNRAKVAPMSGQTSSVWRSWVALVLAAVALLFSGIGLYRVRSDPYDIKAPKELIDSQHFINQDVELDGKAFVNCTFDHVSFIFRGKRPYSIENADVIPPIVMKFEKGRQLDAAASVGLIVNMFCASQKLACMNGQFQVRDISEP